eukprot:scaffold12455_cov62-Phaeocystis_antarctica.AAC.7
MNASGLLMRKMCVEVTTACCAACFTAGLGCAGGLPLPAEQSRACCRAGRKRAAERRSMPST